MPLADFVRYAAMAAREGESFNAWVGQAMFEKAKREQGEKRVADVQNVPKAATTPGRQVRVETTAGVGRLGEVSSESFEANRERARLMAERSGRCTADVARGSRCKLCGQVHGW